MEGAEDIMYLEEEMEQLYKIINKRLYNNDLPVPYFRMHNARYRKKGGISNISKTRYAK